MGWISGSGTAISPTSPSLATTPCQKAFSAASSLGRAIGNAHAPWYPADRGFVNRFFRSALFPLFVIVLLVYLASQTLIPHGKNTQKLTLSEFTSKVTQHQVSSAEFNPSKRSISFKLNDGKKGSVHYPSDQNAPALTSLLQ